MAKYADPKKFLQEHVRTDAEDAVEIRAMQGPNPRKCCHPVAGACEINGQSYATKIDAQPWAVWDAHEKVVRAEYDRIIADPKQAAQVLGEQLGWSFTLKDDELQAFDAATQQAYLDLASKVRAVQKDAAKRIAKVKADARA